MYSLCGCVYAPSVCMHKHGVRVFLRTDSVCVCACTRCTCYLLLLERYPSQTDRLGHSIGDHTWAHHEGLLAVVGFASHDLKSQYLETDPRVDKRSRSQSMQIAVDNRTNLPTITVCVFIHRQGVSMHTQKRRVHA